MSRMWVKGKQKKSEVEVQDKSSDKRFASYYSSSASCDDEEGEDLNIKI